MPSSPTKQKKLEPEAALSSKIVSGTAGKLNSGFGAFEGEMSHFMHPSFLGLVLKSIPAKKVDEKEIEVLLQKAKDEKNFESQASLLTAKGKFKEALSLLDHHSPTNSLNDQVLWGKMSLYQLLNEHQRASESLFTLKTSIDQSANQPTSLQKQILIARTWWIHSSLVALPHLPPQKVVQILDVYLAWINTIQTTCPWVLRYVAFLLIAHYKSRPASQLKEVASLLSADSYLYSDPMTRLLTTIIDLDFESASQSLDQCQTLFQNDFVLKAMPQPLNKDFFFKNARSFVFLQYLRLHRSVAFKKLAWLLQLPVESVNVFVSEFEGKHSITNGTGLEFEGNIHVSSDSSITYTLPKPDLVEVVLSKCAALDHRAAVILQHV